MLGHEDDPEIVDAICVAHDAMPTILPAAFAVCVEEEQREALTQPIELERQRKQQLELEQRIAEQEELERIQQEIEEAERRTDGTIEFRIDTQSPTKNFRCRYKIRIIDACCLRT